MGFPTVLSSLFSLLIALLSTGCTIQHKVLIDPSLPIHDSKIGNNMAISFYVVDARKSNLITKWEKDLRKFSVYPQNDIKDIFSLKIHQILNKLGFIPKHHKYRNNNSLKIKILNIKSEYINKVHKMDVNVQAKLRATCHNNRQKYSNIYFSKKNRIAITPTTFPNENLINANLSELLRKVFTDTQLLTCLSS